MYAEGMSVVFGVAKSPFHCYLKVQLDYVKLGCMRYLSIVIVLATVNAGRHTSGEDGSSALLWTGSATEGILEPLKKVHLEKSISI